MRSQSMGFTFASVCPCIDSSWHVKDHLYIIQPLLAREDICLRDGILAHAAHYGRLPSS